MNTANLYQQQQTTPPELYDLIRVNFVESLREYGRWQQSNNCLEKDGLFLTAGSTPFPVLINCVVRLDSQIPAPEVIEKAKEFFNSLGRDSFTIFCLGECDRDLEAAAEKADFPEVFDAPSMVLATRVTEPKIPTNVEIKRVTDEQGVIDARNINAEAYESLEFPKAQTEAIFGMPAHLLAPQLTIYVAYLNGQPVSTAMTLLTGQIAGVYWVGTKPMARGYGLAEACCRLASNMGFSKGAKQIVLQASPMGEAIYQRMGYRTIEPRLKGYLVDSQA